MIYLERHDGAENIHRFYAMELGCDLFSTWVLIRRWGRIGAGAGRTVLQSFPDEDSARKAEADLARQKQRKGYCLA